MRVGPIPSPVAASPATGFEEVTNGYVPWSRSRRVPQRLVHDQRRVCDVRAEPFRVALVRLGQHLQVEGLEAVDALEPDVLLDERDLDLLPEDLWVEQVLNADPQSGRLVCVGGADAAARRPDLELAEPSLARPVDRQVPGHDQVRVAGYPHERGREAARLEAIQLVDEDGRVDHAAGAEHALLAPEDARRHVP
jgi:hypothetical protein